MFLPTVLVDNLEAVEAWAVFEPGAAEPMAREPVRSRFAAGVAEESPFAEGLPSFGESDVELAVGEDGVPLATEGLVHTEECRFEIVSRAVRVEVQTLALAESTLRTFVAAPAELATHQPAPAAEAERSAPG